MYYLGRIFGWILMAFMIKPMRVNYGYRECSYENEHIIKEFRGKSFIIASNHIKPRNKFLKMISMPYEGFFVRRMFQKHGIYSTVIASYDAEKRTKGSKKPSPSKLRKEKFLKGLIKSLDFIPLNRNENDPDTTRDVRRRITEGNLGIGIFPEGTYFRGYRNGRRLHGGMAILSKRYNIPILPIFVDAYNLNKPLRIAIGNPIWEPMDAHMVAEYIAKEFLRLKERRPVEVEKDDELDISPIVTPTEA